MERETQLQRTDSSDDELYRPGVLYSTGVCVCVEITRWITLTEQTQTHSLVFHII